MQNIQNELTIPERLAAPSPKLFKVIRNVGLILAAVAGTLLGLQTQGIELPVALSTTAEIATAVAGVIAAVVSALTVDVKEYELRQAVR